MKPHLVSLDTSIRLAVLAESVVLGRLVVTARGIGSRRSRGRGRSLARAGGVAALLAGLMGVDFAVCEFAWERVVSGEFCVMVTMIGVDGVGSYE